jgi:hypothetical protein
MSQEWIEAHVGLEGDGFKIGGVAPWMHQWKRVPDGPVQLPHPSHRSELHPFWIYEITTGAKTIKFAATELSAGVWGFYVPTSV